jgi:hypothetical protein
MPWILFGVTMRTVVFLLLLGPDLLIRNLDRVKARHCEIFANDGVSPAVPMLLSLPVTLSTSAASVVA